MCSCLRRPLATVSQSTSRAPSRAELLLRWMSCAFAEKAISRCRGHGYAQEHTLIRINNKEEEGGHDALQLAGPPVCRKVPEVSGNPSSGCPSTRLRLWLSAQDMRWVPHAPERQVLSQTATQQLSACV
jgi:hypothetical protein